MSDQSKRPYLVAYDIADPKRLCRVHKILTRYAVPVQYSVFIGTFTPTNLEALKKELVQAMENDEDDIRMYPISRNADPITIGRHFLPEDVLLFIQNKRADITPLVRGGVHGHDLCDKKKKQEEK